MGREEYCKQISLARVGSAHSVWAIQGLTSLTACVLSQSTLLRLQVAMQGNCIRWALGCVHFPHLSHSGSGSWVLHKGTDLVGIEFCALPRSEQLSQPDAWRVHTPQMWQCILSPPPSQPLSVLGVQREHNLRCAMCLLLGADLWLRPSWWMSTSQNPRKTWLATGNLLTGWQRMLSLGSSLPPCLPALAVACLR